jgi:hypothetical protein
MVTFGEKNQKNDEIFLLKQSLLDWAIIEI